MKYIYIICLALSSFFTYKHLSADSNTHLNTFFIPQGVFQQNTQNKDIQQMKPRYSQSSSPFVQQNTSETITRQNNTLPTPSANNTKNNEPTIKKTSDITTPPSSKPLKTQKASSTHTQKKQNSPQKTVASKYTLEENILPSTPSIAPQQIETTPSPKEEFEQKSIKEMLNTLPTPNFKLPKYQQIYALYGLELRSAYRRGYLPANYEQEKTLSKANSIRRFKVE